MNRNQLHQQFEAIYKQLNPEQQQAVDTIFGPVLVIAGPGTGKTQILSARIARILLETDYLPENMLCLTYTDAGRVAMRKRLQEMIGADAYRVHIHTFHSFCNQVIQENVAYFDKRNLDPVSDLERISFIKQLIDAFTDENPLKRFRGDAYYEIDRLSNLFATMKKEGWSSDFVKERIQLYIDSLPDREDFIAKRKVVTKKKTYLKGDLRTDKVSEEEQKMNILKHAAAAFDGYQAIMAKHHRYDFDDMINWVIRVFQSSDTVLLDYQERFQFILVDEYQDTSGTQNQLVHLLCQDVEQPNIFVVGDDDQSIYRFQGANIENIQEFKSRYASTLKDIVLRSNYRSTQKILDISGSVIKNNTERLTVKYPEMIKELSAGHPSRISSTAEPVLHVYENTFQELAGVSLRIEALIKQGVPAQKIAVIYREHKWGDELLKFFKERQIPFFSKRNENLLHLPLSRKILTILRYIAAERSHSFSGDDLLFEILHFDVYDIPSVEIARTNALAVAYCIKHKKQVSLRSYLNDWIKSVHPTLFETRPSDRIAKVSNMLEKWMTDSYNIPFIELLENIFIEGQFLDFALHAATDKLWQLDVLRALMDAVKEELHRNPSCTPEAFIQILDLMDDQGLSIPLHRTFGNENGVNLLTAHGSKGLEFQYVFLMNTTSSTWEGKRISNTNYKLPDTIMQTIGETDQEAKLQEQRRLFFVAITRAEEYLYISWSKKDDAEKPLEPSQFVAEITDEHSIQQVQHVLSEEEMADFLHIYLLRNKMPVIEQSEQQLISNLLSGFEMNATALNNYLDCPLKFYYTNVIRVPSAKNESMTFGSAVHYALEKLFTKMKEQNDVFPSVEVFIDDFKKDMMRHREHFTKEALSRRLDYGKRILTDLYNAQIDTWPKVVAVEKMYKSIVMNDVPLKGKLDKLEYDGNAVTIVDYKTGAPKNALKKLKPPTAAEPLGGDYWRQGVFYKLLVEGNKEKSHKVYQTVFQFVEPDEDGEYTSHAIIPTEDDLETVRQQVIETWNSIQRHDFYTGCGKEKCQWCNFVKNNGRYAALKSIETDSDDFDNSSN
jgi:DNA helicase II / ATP-dependent DNA helicase PcrA